MGILVRSPVLWVVSWCVVDSTPVFTGGKLRAVVEVVHARVDDRRFVVVYT